MMRPMDAYWPYQMARYGWAMQSSANRGFDFTTALCETPDSFMVRLQEDA